MFAVSKGELPLPELIAITGIPIRNPPHHVYYQIHHSASCPLPDTSFKSPCNGSHNLQALLRLLDKSSNLNGCPPLYNAVALDSTSNNNDGSLI